MEGIFGQLKNVFLDVAPYPTVVDSGKNEIAIIVSVIAIVAVSVVLIVKAVKKNGDKTEKNISNNDVDEK